MARTHLNPRTPMPKIVFVTDPNKQEFEVDTHQVQWIVFGEYSDDSGVITIYTFNIIQNAHDIALQHHIVLKPNEYRLSIDGTIAHEMLHRAYSLLYSEDSYRDHVRMKKNGDLYVMMRYLCRHEHVRRPYVINDAFNTLNQEIASSQ
ncbi:MAG: hypothetical protein KGI60_01110 [Patescibacteria group bacterium]|nr:hypothetical protein [Patescibacteria group bacterium]